MKYDGLVLRSEVIREIELFCHRVLSRDGINTDWLHAMLDEIRDIPGHELVLCGQCKRWEPMEGIVWGRGWCKLLGEETCRTFYCQQGEQIEEEEPSRDDESAN